MDLFSIVFNMAMRMLNTSITVFGATFTFFQFAIVSSIFAIIFGAVRKIFD